MSTKQKQPAVICIRVDDAKPGQVIEGSRKIACSRCEHTCWQAPATWDQSGRIICSRCLPAYMAGIKAVVPSATFEMGVLPGSLDEFRDWVRRNTGQGGER